jgi:hypothetical protein
MYIERALKKNNFSSMVLSIVTAFTIFIVVGLKIEWAKNQQLEQEKRFIEELR